MKVFKPQIALNKWNKNKNKRKEKRKEIKRYHCTKIMRLEIGYTNTTRRLIRITQKSSMEVVKIW